MNPTLKAGPHITVTSCPASHEVGPEITVLPGPSKPVIVTGETPREGAVRELAEETGLELVVADRPAFAAVRSYRSDWSATPNLSYWAIADSAMKLLPEVGQPAHWVDVGSDWRTFHKQDAAVMARFAEQQGDS
ncbi:NUDIX domain-containing protein [Arthrobacter sp. 2YAF22_2]|uniref:NUDIX domain-containing protein n=1 Tax=Arthrobacter sp. 2YAF22_2 TaxID=3233029 RepID=UPI003F8F8C62